MNRNPIILLIAFFVSGCAAHQALDDLNATKAAYKACVAQHPKGTATACKHEKEAYEFAGQTYQGMQLGGDGLDADTSRH